MFLLKKKRLQDFEVHEYIQGTENGYEITK